MLIFGFDFLAWGVFFNQILQGGLLKVGRFTAIAMALGCGLAMFFFLYERAVMTFDTSQGKRRLYNAMMLRSVVILVGGALTTQPIELLLFKESIKRRIREESIRREIVIKWPEFNYLYTHKDSTTNMNQATDKACGEELSTAKTRTHLAETALASAKRQHDANQNENLKADYERNVRTASSALQRAREKEGGAQGKCDQAEKREKDTVNAHKQDVLDPLKRIQDGIQKIRDLPLDASNVDVDGKGKWLFSDREYDFIQQLRVLADLRDNNEPDWPDATMDQKQDYEKQFTLTYAKEKYKNESRLYFTAWCLVFGFSFIVPLMSFLYKILLPRELADYYSSAFQRSLGNPEARAYEEARKQAERDRQLRFEESSALS